MSDSRRFAKPPADRAVEAARPILGLINEPSSPIREARCQAAQSMTTAKPGICFAVGKKDTVLVTVWGHNRRQTIVVKVKAPFTGTQAVDAIRTRWEGSNPIPKNFRGLSGVGVASITPGVAFSARAR